MKILLEIIKNKKDLTLIFIRLYKKHLKRALIKIIVICLFNNNNAAIGKLLKIQTLKLKVQQDLQVKSEEVEPKELIFLHLVRPLQKMPSETSFI